MATAMRASTILLKESGLGLSSLMKIHYVKTYRIYNGANVMGLPFKTGISFVMTDVRNRVPMAGLSVSVTLSEDGGPFKAAMCPVYEVGKGVYHLHLTHQELSGEVVMMRATAQGADDLFLTLASDFDVNALCQEIMNGKEVTEEMWADVPLRQRQKVVEAICRRLNK